MSAAPTLVNIPTGRAQQVLCLQAFRAEVWAGLYPDHLHRTPSSIGVDMRRRVRMRGQMLVVGALAAPLNARTAHRVQRWCAGHGIPVQHDGGAA